MTAINRRFALTLGAAALASAALPAVAAIPPAPAAASVRPTWIVGRPGEYDWQAVRAATQQDAILEYLAEYGPGPTCEAIKDGEPASDDCDCCVCITGRQLDVDRIPAFDGKPLNAITSADWITAGLGAICSRCGYETSEAESGEAISDQAVCWHCVTAERNRTLGPDPVAARQCAEIST